MRFVNYVFLNTLGKRTQCLHRVNNFAFSFSQRQHVWNEVFKNILEAFDLFLGQRYAFFNFGRSVLQDVQENVPQSAGRFSTGALRVRCNCTNGRRQFINPYVRLLRNRSDNTNTFCDLLNACRIVIANGNNTVKNSTKTLGFIVKVVGRVNSQKHLCGRFLGNLANDLQSCGNFSQFACQIAITSAGKRHNVRQVVGGLNAILGRDVVGLFLILAHFRFAHPADAPDCCELRVHFPHGVQSITEAIAKGVPNTACYPTCKRLRNPVYAVCKLVCCGSGLPSSLRSPCVCSDSRRFSVDFRTFKVCLGLLVS